MANKISVVIDVAVDRANSALKNFRSSVSDADGAVGKFRAGAASAGASLKANLVPLAASAGVAVAAFAAKSIAAASDLEESTNAVNKSFGEAAEGVLKIGENSAESFGLSKAEFNEAAVSFSSFAETVAGEGGDVAGTIGDLTTRAADFASTMNTSVAEASTIFRSGLSGETEPLKRFGIDLSAAAVEAYALANGLVKSKSEMTEAIKVQARYGLLMEKTSKFAGDFADTSDGLANSTRIAQARITDFQAEIGEQLIPTVAAAVNVAMDLADGLEAIGIQGMTAGEKLGDGGFLGAVQDQLNPIAALGKGYNTAKGYLDDLTGSGEEATEVIYGQSQALVEQSIKSAMAERASKDLAAAEQRTAAEIERKSDVMDEAREAIIRSTEATLGAIDADLGYRQAVESTNEVLADAESSALDVESAILSQAAASLRLAEDTAEANGKTLTASDRNAVYRSELEKLVAEIDGPAADAIRRHIDALGRIPATVRTALSVAGKAPTASVSGYRAKGGPVNAGGAYVVGEDGPELLQMGSQSGNVIPNGATVGVGGSGAINIYVSGLTGPQVADDIADKLMALKRRNGKLPWE